MPHTKRIVEPVLVSRGQIDPTAKDELECMTNNTLANVIRELSSLSRHAEDLFAELTQEILSVSHRSSQLQKRIDDLRDKATQLNPNVDVLNLQDIHLQKPFKSSINKEQQVLSRSTVPRAILDVYVKCDAPPALDKLDKFREDGKQSMKYYTDPSYFAELWAKEIDKQITENKNELQKKRKKKPPEQRKQHNVREAKAKTKEKFQRAKDGVEFSDYQDTKEIRRKIDKEQREANQVRLQRDQDEALVLQQQQQQQEAIRQQHEYEQREAWRQSQRQQQPQQYQQQQQQVRPQHLHNEQGLHYTQMDDQQPYPNDVTMMNRDYSHHPPPPQFGDPQRDSQEKLANGGVNNRKTVNLHSPHRPSAAPPPPPTEMTNSLPPPPSPPLPMEMMQGSPPISGHQASMYPDMGRMMHTNQQRNSPVRQPSYGSRQDADLPPPPPSPPGVMPDMSIGSCLLPPPPPSPPDGSYMTNNVQAPPAPPPPPPPPPPMSIPKKEMNGDSISVSSSSTSTGLPAGDGSKAPAGADRSALMTEIIQVDRNKRLKKVEAREQKKIPTAPGALDVQALMDKAIEMRRKVIEISDSGGEESDDDDEWGDSD